MVNASCNEGDEEEEQTNCHRTSTSPTIPRPSKSAPRWYACAHTCRFSVYFPDSSPAAAGRTARVCQSSNLRKAGLIAIKRPNTLHCPFMGRVLSVPQCWAIRQLLQGALLSWHGLRVFSRCKFRFFFSCCDYSYFREQMWRDLSLHSWWLACSVGSHLHGLGLQSFTVLGWVITDSGISGLQGL